MKILVYMGQKRGERMTKVMQNEEKSKINVHILVYMDFFL